MSQTEMKQKELDQTKYEGVIESSKFKQLMSEKKKFIVPFTIFFLAFYFALPIMTSFTDVLNKPAVGEITWAWIFAFAEFIMTWVLLTIYMKKSTSFDKLSKEIIEEEIVKGGNHK